MEYMKYIYHLSSHDHIFSIQFVCAQTSAQNKVKFCLSTARAQFNSSAAGFTHSQKGYTQSHSSLSLKSVILAR